MSPNGKFLWLGGALVFLITVGIAQLSRIVLHAATGVLSEPDAVLVLGAAAFAGFCTWVVAR